MIHDEELDVEQRVAAVDTFRRFQCDQFQAYFLSLLRNTHLDSEIRIAAYLRIMQCPNYFVIQSLRYLLEIEEVNQGQSLIKNVLYHFFISAVYSRIFYLEPFT